jgi:branched-chain amino acid transport system substrate-binding protein
VIKPTGRRTGVLLAAVAGVAALVAGACSSSSHSSSSSGTTATTAASNATTPTSSSAATNAPVGAATSGTSDAMGSWWNEPVKQPTGTPFKIGYIYAPGQLLAEPNLTPNALRTWVDWQNAHNGVNGHPIQLIIKQDPGNPGVALLAVENLVGQHIVALIDGDGENDAGFTSYILKQPVAVFTEGFDSLPMASSTGQFSTVVSQYYLFDEIMQAAQKVGGHKMAVLYCAESPACKQTIAPLQAAGKQFGIPVVFNASVLASSPNYTAQCLAARNAGADVMFIADGTAPTLAVASSCQQQGYTPHQVSDEAAYSVQMAGKPGWNGFLGTQDNIPFFVTSTPGSKALHDAYAQYEPSVPASSQYSVGETLLFTTGLLIAASAEAGAVGTTNPMTGPALVNGVYTLHTTNLGGMVPTLTFVRGQPDQNHCWFWAGIKNNQWYLPFGLSTTCATPIKSS